MDRTEKSSVVDGLRDRFAKSPFLILANFQGSNPFQMDAIRRKYRPIGVEFKVVKNTLAKRAIAGTPMEVLAQHFKGNTGVIFSGEDAQAAARLFKELAKENEKLVAKAGFHEGAVLDPKEVVAVAELESKDQLLSKLLATMTEPPRQVLGVIQGPARDLLYLLQNFSSKLEETG